MDTNWAIALRKWRRDVILPHSTAPCHKICLHILELGFGYRHHVYEHRTDTRRYYRQKSIHIRLNRDWNCPSNKQIREDWCIRHTYLYFISLLRFEGLDPSPYNAISFLQSSNTQHLVSDSSTGEWHTSQRVPVKPGAQRQWMAVPLRSSHVAPFWQLPGMQWLMSVWTRRDIQNKRKNSQWLNLDGLTLLCAR